MFGKTKAHQDKVLVDRAVLRDYVTEYHHNGMYGRCKACGQDWPCVTYNTLRTALDTPNHCC